MGVYVMLERLSTSNLRKLGFGACLSFVRLEKRLSGRFSSNELLGLQFLEFVSIARAASSNDHDPSMRAVSHHPSNPSFAWCHTHKHDIH